MAETPGTSIDASSPPSPTSSPSSTPPDLIDEATPRLKSPWSQVVRGSPNPPRSKPDALSGNLQTDDEQNEKQPHLHLASELRVTDTAAIHVSPMSSPSADTRQGSHDMLSEMFTTSPDRIINESGPVDSKTTHQSPAKSPKPAWGKIISSSASNLEPEPVMGAVAWPALSEARTVKVSESSKTGTGQKSGAKLSSSVTECHHLQAPPVSDKEVGGIDQNMANKKTIIEAVVNGNNPPNSVTIETGSPHKITGPTNSEQSRWSSGRDSRLPAASEGSPIHPRGTVASHSFHKESTRNFIWDQGRGNRSFPAYGRAHTSVREHTVPGHHQRGGQRNMPQSFVPIFNPNPGFIHPVGYQNVPSNMYYMPGSTAEPVMGATYFIPSGVQGMFMPSPDLLTVQGMVVKQIEYYFSVENLCRDIYLRSKMDEWGFVPVSVIANFNRVKMITQNPYFIVEALRLSNVVEVQGDKVRKKGDWANWLLPASQQLSASLGDRDQAVKLSTSSRKAEVDPLKSDNSRSAGVENQRNRHSHLASQMRETVGAHSVTSVNVQGVTHDSLSPEGAQRMLNKERLQDLEVDENESRRFAQTCAIESGPQN